MHVIPPPKTLSDPRTIPLLQNKRSKLVYLSSATRDWTAALAVDSGGTDDSRLDHIRVFGARVENDLVHVTVEGRGGQVDQLIDALPVIEDLGILLSECLPNFRVKVRQDTGPAGVQPEPRSRGGMAVHETLGYGRCRTGVVRRVGRIWTRLAPLTPNVWIKR